MTYETIRNARYPVSYQLYTSRNFPPVDAHLPHLKEMGYDAVEPWPAAYEEDPQAFRRALDAAGLDCFGFHMPWHGLSGQPERYVEVAQALGAGHMIVPHVPEEDRVATCDFWLGVGEKLMRAAELAAASGIRVAWHNHEFEYSPLPDGSRPIDRIFEGAGETVGFEIDCGWAIRAGTDLAAEFDRHGERIVAIHLKDTAPEGTRVEDGWTAIGDGTVDWTPLAACFRKSRAEYIVAEHDNPRDWKAFAQRSIRGIRDLGL